MFYIVLILFFEVLDEEENHDAVVFLIEINYQSNLILVSMKQEGCGVVLTCIICVVVVVL